jgi:hypothetical protein
MIMIEKNRFRIVLLVTVIAIAINGCSKPVINDRNKLADWRKGVWITGEGTYTIYTDNHYFVLSYEGDSASPNIYCGASQLIFHNKGTARKQLIRLRQNPGGNLYSYRDKILVSDSVEARLVIDTNLFTPGTCNIKDGIIYDAVTEVTDDYILLATCNGDKEKIYSNGVSVYLPAGGGEYYSYRIEKL